MNFEEIVAILTPFFQQNKFSVAETFKNYIRYENRRVKIAVAYDWRDNSITVFVGQIDKFETELSGDTIDKFFNDNINLRNNNLFTENLISFLTGKGNALLKEDLNTLFKLEEYSNRMAKEYTDNLIKEQNLRAADDAWQEKNYSEFITQLDKIKKDSLSQTYLMKYQYALKIKNQ